MGLDVGVLAFPLASHVYGGNPWLVWRLVDNLAAQNPEDTYHLVFYGELSNDVARANVDRLVGRHANIVPHHLVKGRPAIKWCVDNADVVWGTVSGVLRTDAVPQVFSLQDVRMLTAYRESLRGYVMHKAGLEYAMRRASVIVALSEFTRREVLRVYPRSRHVARMDVVYPGVPAGFDDPSGVEAVRPPTVAEGPFATTIYDPLPQKRMELLERTTGVLEEHGWQLVCIGPMRGADRDHVVEHPRVLYPGYVESSVMPSYIKASSLFLFPSEYEGFGLPPFEAMSLGVPVLYNSRCEVLREEIGDIARSFSTDEELPARLGELLVSPEARAACVAGCGDLIARYSWARAARQYRYIFQVAVDRPLADIDFPSGAVRPSREVVGGPEG